ncbi:MAG: AAA family ATPase [Candidatus Thorarchaeota archaeon]
MTQFLLALCGIPASGKTTLAREIQLATSKDWNSVLVSTDDWRDNEYYSPFKPEKEGDVRKKALSLTRTFLARKQSVVHDDTNYYSSMRHELFCLAEEFRCVFGIIYVKTPLETALKWNTLRETKIPPDVVSRIHSKFDMPGEKYAWDSPVYVVDLNEKDASSAVAGILEELRDLRPVTQKVTSTPGTTEQFDTTTRRVVKEFLTKEPFFRNDPEVSRIRKLVLQEALREKWSLDATQNTLWEKLNELVNEDSE